MKTEGLLTSTKLLSKMTVCSDDRQVTPCTVVSNIGVSMKPRASTEARVNCVLRAAHFRLYNIGRANRLLRLLDL